MDSINAVPTNDPFKCVALTDTSSTFYGYDLADRASPLYPTASTDAVLRSEIVTIEGRQYFTFFLPQPHPILSLGSLVACKGFAILEPPGTQNIPIPISWYENPKQETSDITQRILATKTTFSPPLNYPQPIQVDFFHPIAPPKLASAISLWEGFDMTVTFPLGGIGMEPYIGSAYLISGQYGYYGSINNVIFDSSSVGLKYRGSTLLSTVEIFARLGLPIESPQLVFTMQDLRLATLPNRDTGFVLTIQANRFPTIKGEGSLFFQFKNLQLYRTKDETKVAFHSIQRTMKWYNQERQSPIESIVNHSSTTIVPFHRNSAPAGGSIVVRNTDSPLSTGDKVIVVDLQSTTQMVRQIAQALPVLGTIVEIEYTIPFSSSNLNTYGLQHIVSLPLLHGWMARWKEERTFPEIAQDLEIPCALGHKGSASLVWENVRVFQYTPSFIDQSRRTEPKIEIILESNNLLANRFGPLNTAPYALHCRVNVYVASTYTSIDLPQTTEHEQYAGFSLSVLVERSPPMALPFGSLVHLPEDTKSPEKAFYRHEMDSPRSIAHFSWEKYVLERRSTLYLTISPLPTYLEKGDFMELEISNLVPLFAHPDAFCTVVLKQNQSDLVGEEIRSQMVIIPSQSLGQPTPLKIVFFGPVPDSTVGSSDANDIPFLIEPTDAKTERLLDIECEGLSFRKPFVTEERDKTSIAFKTPSHVRDSTESRLFTGVRQENSVFLHVEPVNLFPSIGPGSIGHFSSSITNSSVKIGFDEDPKREELRNKGDLILLLSDALFSVAYHRIQFTVDLPRGLQHEKYINGSTLDLCRYQYISSDQIPPTDLELDSEPLESPLKTNVILYPETNEQFAMRLVLSFQHITFDEDDRTVPRSFKITCPGVGHIIDPIGMDLPEDAYFQVVFSANVIVPGDGDGDEKHLPIGSFVEPLNRQLQVQFAQGIMEGRFLFPFLGIASPYLISMPHYPFTTTTPSCTVPIPQGATVITHSRVYALLQIVENSNENNTHERKIVSSFYSLFADFDATSASYTFSFNLALEDEHGLVQRGSRLEMIIFGFKTSENPVEDHYSQSLHMSFANEVRFATWSSPAIQGHSQLPPTKPFVSHEAVIDAKRNHFDLSFHLSPQVPIPMEGSIVFSLPNFTAIESENLLRIYFQDRSLGSSFSFSHPYTMVENVDSKAILIMPCEEFHRLPGKSDHMIQSGPNRMCIEILVDMELGRELSLAFEGVRLHIEHVNIPAVESDSSFYFAITEHVDGQTKVVAFTNDLHVSTSNPLNLGSITFTSNTMHAMEVDTVKFQLHQLQSSMSKGDTIHYTFSPELVYHFSIDLTSVSTVSLDELSSADTGPFYIPNKAQRGNLSYCQLYLQQSNKEQTVIVAPESYSLEILSYLGPTKDKTHSSVPISQFSIVVQEEFVPFQGKTVSSPFSISLVCSKIQLPIQSTTGKIPTLEITHITQYQREDESFNEANIYSSIIVGSSTTALPQVLPMTVQNVRFTSENPKSSVVANMIVSIIMDWRKIVSSYAQSLETVNVFTKFPPAWTPSTVAKCVGSLNSPYISDAAISKISIERHPSVGFSNSLQTTEDWFLSVIFEQSQLQDLGKSKKLYIFCSGVQMPLVAESGNGALGILEMQTIPSQTSINGTGSDWAGQQTVAQSVEVTCPSIKFNLPQFHEVLVVRQSFTATVVSHL